MKTIYFYGIDNNKGGMETYAYNLIKGITEKTNEFKFHIISQFEDFTFKDELVDKLGCDYTIVPKRASNPFKYSKAIEKVLKSANKDDIFQINVMSCRNVFLFHAAKKSKIQTVIVGHSTNADNKLNYFIHKLGRYHYRKLGIKVGNNKHVIDYLFGKKCNDFNIIELGINKELFKYDLSLRLKIRKNLGLNDDEFAIGQIGRICYTKNQLFSCKLMEQINNPKIKLFFFGKIIDDKAIDYVNHHNIQNIKFLGETNNVNEIYNALDLVLLPSHHESAGFALYEALENGCPTIISSFVPTEGVQSKQLYKLELSEKIWINKIIECKTSYNISKRKDSNNITPSFELQIQKYIDLYRSLNK